MSILITAAQTPLMTETLPAVKLTHFYGQSAAGRVYAYLRLYALRGGFCFNMTHFMQNPPDGTQMRLYLTAADGSRSVCIACAPQGDAVITAADGSEQPLAVRHFKGGDEQGWYWACEGELTSEQCFALLGQTAEVGSVWGCNVTAQCGDETAFSAAYAVPQNTFPPQSAALDTLTVVPY